jgi:HEAT repeat protein
VPLLAADGPPVWSDLVKIARDDGRPGEVRRQATFWLAQGASARVDPRQVDSDDDEVRKSAVFALSQQPRNVAIPALIDAAANGKNAAVRASALFWLGQSGDSRGLPVFGKILGIAP